VTRTVPAIAAVLVAAAALFGSVARACVSCEYSPEVVGTPSKPQGTKPQAKEHPRVKERSHTVDKVRRPAENSVVKRAPAVEPAAKDVETAKSTGTETKEESGKPASSTATSALIEAQTRKDSSTGVATPAATPAEVPTQSETAATSTAIVAAPQAPVEAKVEAAKTEAPKAEETKPENKEAGCKKFFPAVELTLMVPCE
jgi:hypothetical protein